MNGVKRSSIEVSHIADWLIATGLEQKYRTRVQLAAIDDSLEHQTHDYIVDSN